MRLPLLISELLPALVALELKRVEGLHDKSVDLGALEVGTAPRARLLLRQPLADAPAAVEPVAVAALLGRLNDSDANVAAEHVLEVFDGLLGQEVLRTLRLLFCSGLDRRSLPGLDFLRIDHETFRFDLWIWNRLQHCLIAIYWMDQFGGLYLRLLLRIV